MLKNEYNRQYYVNNKEKIKENMRSRYVGETAEKIKERQKFIYYQKNNRLTVLKERYPNIYNKFILPP